MCDPIKKLPDAPRLPDEEYSELKNLIWAIRRGQPYDEARLTDLVAKLVPPGLASLAVSRVTATAKKSGGLKDWLWAIYSVNVTQVLWMPPPDWNDFIAIRHEATFNGMPHEASLDRLRKILAGLCASDAYESVLAGMLSGSDPGHLVRIIRDHAKQSEVAP